MTTATCEAVQFVREHRELQGTKARAKDPPLGPQGGPDEGLTVSMSAKSDLMKSATSDGRLQPIDRSTGPETMKTIVQDEYGAAPEEVLRLAQVAQPTIAADQVMVRVRAASVDRGTWHIMAGLPYPIRVMGFGPGGPRPRTRAGAWPGPSSRSAKM